jgi:LysR family transcriptional regulator, hypochlorite-specific transcription factor HypT
VRSEWLEDILALLEAGSINKAAEARFVSQPAFSRRLMAVEEHLGIELLDRSRRPAAISKLLRDHEPKFRELVSSMRELAIELKHDNRERRNQIAIATPHAIATATAPHLISFLTAAVDVNVRLRSTNHDDCRALLMTRQCDLAIVYRGAQIESDSDDEHVEEFVLGKDLFVPVIASNRAADIQRALDRGEVCLIAYPTDVFLGRIMAREIYPQLPSNAVIQKRTETELTLAALQLALAGVGISWVPISLARSDLSSGRLTSLASTLPSSEFSIVVQRLTGHRMPIETLVWEAIQAYAPSGAAPIAVL